MKTGDAVALAAIGIGALIVLGLLFKPAATQAPTPTQTPPTGQGQSCLW